VDNVFLTIANSDENFCVMYLNFLLWLGIKFFFHFISFYVAEPKQHKLDAAPPQTLC
jgi:hypothetical protein